jgi:hypothetical protein
VLDGAALGATDKARLDQLFRGRWLIADIELKVPAVAVVARGEGYPPLDPFFGRTTTGPSNLAQLGDEAYSRWLIKSYAEALIEDVPRFEEVDALIRWSRTGDTRTRYWRILVPLRADATSGRLLTASGNDTSIDLRSQPVAVAPDLRQGLVG